MVSGNQAVPARTASSFTTVVATCTYSLHDRLCLCPCHAFPGAPRLPYSNIHSSTLNLSENRGRHCPELLQEPRAYHHLGCAYCDCRVAENLLDVHTWSSACPHSLSLFTPVPAFQEDVSHSLASIAALALVGVGLVDGVEVCAQADFAVAHLRDDRADGSMCAHMCCEDSFSRSHSESEQFSSVFG